MMAKKVARILSIDGGGIRGIIPATILGEWEKVLGPIASKFHMIAGTSTGGIIACGITQNKPMKAADLAKFYIDNGPDIFSSPLGALGGLTGDKYDASILEEAITKVISGNLSSVKNDLLVTSYAIEQRAPFLFKSWKAQNIDGDSASDDFPLAAVARATSAAPTYFAPALITNAGRKQYALIDGGVYANNPAMAAYVAARRLYPMADEYVVVSLGTGATVTPFPYSDAESWGLAGWLRPLLDIMFDGVSSTVDYELSQLAPQVTHSRFQSDLKGASDLLDDVTPQNLKALSACGLATLQKMPKESAAILARLKEPMTDRADLGYPKPLGSTKTPTKAINPIVKTVASASTAIGVPISTGGAIGGATVGALVGGPVGAAIGGFLGWLGLKTSQ